MGLAEGDSLSKRQVVAVVDGDSATAHVLLPGLAARLAATASLLVSAECATNLSTAARGVDVGDASVGASGSNPLEHVVHAVAEERRRETLGDAVVLLDGLVKGLDLHDVHDRGEHLLLNTLGAVVDLDNAGLHKVARAGHALAADQHLATEALSVLDSVLEHLHGGGVVKRAKQSLGVQGVAVRDLLVRGDEGLHEAVVDALLQVQAAQAGAALASRADGSEQHSALGHLDVAVLHNDHGVVSSQLQERAAEAASDSLVHDLTDLGAAGEGQQVNASVVGHCLADVGSAAAEGSNAGVRAGLLEDIGHDLLCGNGQEGRRGGRFPDLGVARDERHRGVPSEHGVREVESADDANVAQGGPCLEHHVVGALRRQNLTRDLTAHAARQLTHVNVFLHFTDTLRTDFPHLKGNHGAKSSLLFAKGITHQAHKVATNRGRGCGPRLLACLHVLKAAVVIGLVAQLHASNRLIGGGVDSRVGLACATPALAIVNTSVVLTKTQLLQERILGVRQLGGIPNHGVMGRRQSTASRVPQAQH
mmetsp:Transcript_16672/g.39219  ORF Transcript_16672/g.39219 Transcript_16672/m.39219 type:complete len:535 (-) Transcript_16672:7-1611(-)